MSTNRPPSTGTALTPVEMYERWFEQFPFYRYLALETEEARPGYARLAMPTGPHVFGGVGGSVHGGILAALVDIAMLRAIVPLFEADDEPGGTVDLGLTYLRPTFGSRVTVEANVLRRGKAIAVTEVSILDDQARLCAKGRALYAFKKKE